MRSHRTLTILAGLAAVAVAATIALGATTGGTSGAPGLAALRADVTKLLNGPRLEVQAAVDEAACGNASVQCGDAGSGHTFLPAASTNHNPVAVAVLVTRNGRPRPGLGSAAFDWSNRTVPAGGPGSVRCPAGGTGCASTDLFQDAGDGIYVIWVHPGPAGANWKAGRYFGRVTVTDPGGRKGSALVTITIP
ncbi:MAG TPA: hypothetical protein PKD59_02135 [Miltoncostaeaceae bacterium]|nr:hypothetical protein [Miltoncostaeaceae bacterium]